MLQTGDAAPGFSLLDQFGKTRSLADYVGQKLLIFFYPEADTPGCTRQSCSVRDSLLSLGELGVAAVGVSPDSSAAQQRFDTKFGLGFPLLADTKRAMAESYGAWGEKTVSGKTRMGIIRSSFLVDEAGRLEGVWYGVKPEQTVPNVIGALRKT